MFNTHLLTDMGKTIARKHVHNTDAQAVWKDFQEHMKSSLKGVSEKRRLTQYVTNTVLDDNFKGAPQQFVLHFNEQFRQLDEISEASELFSPTVKLILLQNAVRNISDLRIVHTQGEFQSTTRGYGKSTNIKYETFYDLLINHVLGMTRHTRQIMAKGATVILLSPKMLKIPLAMTNFHQKTHGSPLSKALIHSVVSSTMSAQPQLTIQDLLCLKTFS